MTEETLYQRSLHEFNVRDEVLKLSLIVEESKAPIYPSYILEKLERISNGVPIALDLLKQAKFNQLKAEAKAEAEREEHARRHKELHRYLDELLADFIRITGKRPSDTNIFELLEWSNRQTTNPETKGAF